MKEVRHLPPEGSPFPMPSTKELGGKGANLFDLAQVFGDSVPSGFVVTADGYNEFVQQSEIQGLEWVEEDGVVDLDWIQSNRQRGDVTLSEIQDTTEDVFLNNQMPSNYEAAIDEALQGYEPEFFTRSSAVNEDGNNNSGAGRLESYGPFTNTEEVLEGTRKVYSSAFSETALGYLLNNDLDSFGGVAVPVQEKAETDFGGVTYTSRGGEIHIEVSHSPSDIVEGEKDGIIRVDRDDIPSINEGEPLESQIEDASLEDYEFLNQGELEPSNDEILRLAMTGLYLEDTAAPGDERSPRDIEYGFNEENGFMLLQSRPDTNATPVSEKPFELDEFLRGYDLPEEDIFDRNRMTINAGVYQGPALVLEDAGPREDYTVKGDENLRRLHSELENYVLVTPHYNDDIHNVLFDNYDPENLEDEKMSGVVASASGLGCHASAVVGESLPYMAGVEQNPPEETLENGDNVLLATDSQEAIFARYDGGDQL